MLQSSVYAHWDPTKPMIANRFVMVRRLNKFVLKSSESVALQSEQKTKKLITSEFSTRKDVPCYLTLVRDISADSVIE